MNRPRGTVSSKDIYALMSLVLALKKLVGDLMADFGIDNIQAQMRGVLGPSKMRSRLASAWQKYGLRCPKRNARWPCLYSIGLCGMCVPFEFLSNFAYGAGVYQALREDAERSHPKLGPAGAVYRLLCLVGAAEAGQLKDYILQMIGLMADLSEGSLSELEEEVMEEVKKELEEAEGAEWSEDPKDRMFYAATLGLTFADIDVTDPVGETSFSFDFTRDRLGGEYAPSPDDSLEEFCKKVARNTAAWIHWEQHKGERSFSAPSRMCKKCQDDATHTQARAYLTEFLTPEQLERLGVQAVEAK